MRAWRARAPPPPPRRPGGRPSGSPPELCQSYPCQCPSQSVEQCLNNEWVQYEVRRTFLGRGMGMNITAHHLHLSNRLSVYLFDFFVCLLLLALAVLCLLFLPLVAHLHALLALLPALPDAGAGYPVPHPVRGVEARAL